MLTLLFWSIVVAITALAWLAWATLRPGAARRRIARAREQFDAHRAECRDRFLAAASATGKPRGLRWKAPDWGERLALAREKDTGRLALLVEVTLAFEAVEDGDMEGVAAVGNLRNASALFFYHQGAWHTTGKAIFNLNPDEVIARLGGQYEAVAEAS